jgi:hypothetical protein
VKYFLNSKLSEWAKRELKEARETSEKEYLSNDEVKRKILAKK